MFYRSCQGKLTDNLLGELGDNILDELYDKGVIEKLYEEFGWLDPVGFKREFLQKLIDMDPKEFQRVYIEYLIDNKDPDKIKRERIEYLSDMDAKELTREYIQHWINKDSEEFKKGYIKSEFNKNPEEIKRKCIEEIINMNLEKFEQEYIKNESNIDSEEVKKKFVEDLSNRDPEEVKKERIEYLSNKEAKEVKKKYIDDESSRDPIEVKKWFIEGESDRDSEEVKKAYIEYESNKDPEKLKEEYIDDITEDFILGFIELNKEILDKLILLGLSKKQVLNTLFSKQNIRKVTQEVVNIEDDPSSTGEITDLIQLEPIDNDSTPNLDKVIWMYIYKVREMNDHGLNPKLLQQFENLKGFYDLLLASNELSINETMVDGTLSVLSDYPEFIKDEVEPMIKVCRKCLEKRNTVLTKQDVKSIKSSEKAAIDYQSLTVHCYPQQSTLVQRVTNWFKDRFYDVCNGLINQVIVKVVMYVIPFFLLILVILLSYREYKTWNDELSQNSKAVDV